MASITQKERPDGYSDLASLSDSSDLVLIRRIPPPTIFPIF